MTVIRRTPAWSLAVWAAWLCTAGIVTYVVASSLLFPPTDLHAFAVIVVASALGALSLASVGAVLATRLPRNAIGWLLYASGLLFGFALVAPVPLPLDPAITPWIAWLASLIWLPGIIPAGVLLPLLFPTGHLPSPRWRPVVLLAVAAVLFGDLHTAFAPFHPGTVPPGIQNPLALGGWPATLAEIGGAGYALAGLVWFPLVAASLVLRYRRAEGSERAQLRWLAAALGIIGPSGAVAVATAGATSGWLTIVSAIAWLLVLVGLVLLPFAVGVAVLRYRLYDIDILLNRTAVYASVSATLAAMVVIGNVALQQILQVVTHQRSELLTIGLAFAAGLMFAPMRRRLRPLIDRLLPSRAELALLFTDIVGSTQTLVEIGDQRWRALLAQYLAVVRSQLAHFGGHEVNTAGDAFFATFPRPLDALRAAWAIRAAVKELGLETRTGLHLGEVEMRGEQVSGLAVHTAARVMAAAGDGEILISDALREAVDAPEVATADRGRHELKGVPGDWQLYAVEIAG